MSYLPTLSHSRRYTWAACRKKYDFQYNKRLKVLPTDVRVDDWKRFSFGILVHGAMEAAFRGEPLESGIEKAVDRFESNNELDDAKRAILPQMKFDALETAKRACDWLPVSNWRPLVHPGTGVSMVEAKLQTDLPGWAGFLGYADLVAEHIPTGRKLVIDYKVRANFEAHDADRFSTQFAYYQRALRDMGVEVHGSLLFEMKSGVAKRKPRFVRNDPGGIDCVRESPDGRFRTTPTYRSDAFVDNVWADFQKEAAEIARLHNDPSALYRNMNGFGCSGCKYQRVCLAEANEEHAEFIEESQYGISIVE